MMYIIDLDNTIEVFDMTLIPAGEEENEKAGGGDTQGTIDTVKMDTSVSMEDLKSLQNNDDYLLQETERIIEEARQETNRIMESTHKKLAELNQVGKMIKRQA
jgi:hypothetical protein